MEILTGLLAFATELSIRHVLALNLIGWMIKSFLQHRNWDSWTDIIPLILGACGIIIAYVDQSTYEANFIIYGLANAGMAWLLHKAVKETRSIVETTRKTQ